MDTILLNYFAIFPTDFFLGIISFFICVFVIVTLLDIINI